MKNEVIGPGFSFSALQPEAAAGPLLVASRKRKGALPDDAGRRGHPVRKDRRDDSLLPAVEPDRLLRPGLHPGGGHHRRPDPERAGPHVPDAGDPGAALGAPAVRRGGADRDEPIPPVRGGQGQRPGQAAGHDRGGSLCRRGRAVSPQLRGADDRAVLRGRQPDLSELQPQRRLSLHQDGLHRPGGRNRAVPAPLHHGGQPDPVPGDPGELCPGLHGGVLPAVHPGGMGQRGRRGLSHVGPGGKHLRGKGPPDVRGDAALLRRRLRHGEPLRVPGRPGRRAHLLHRPGILLGLRRGPAAEDRRGIRGGPGRLSRRGPGGADHHRPQRRLLQGGAAEPGIPDSGRGEQRAGGDRDHRHPDRQSPGEGGKGSLPGAAAGDPVLCMG